MAEDQSTESYHLLFKIKKRIIRIKPVAVMTATGFFYGKYFLNLKLNMT